MKYIFDISLAVLLAVSMSVAQENWGPPEEVWMFPGGWINTANPTFYHDGFVCFEDIAWEENTYKLYYKPILEWLEPILIPSSHVNSDTFHTISPFVSFDGSSLYFASDRPGGYGGLDIWVSEWDGAIWLAPDNLGPNINSELNEYGPSLPLDEQTLYFTRSNRDWDGYQPLLHGSIYVSYGDSSDWTAAEELPGNININNQTWEPSITADGQNLYFSARRPENPTYYFAYVSNRLDDGWSDPQALNDHINHLMWAPWDSSYWGAVPSVTIDSGGTALLFTYWPASECPDVRLRISYLTVDVDASKLRPCEFALISYPNPFNAETHFRFALLEPSFVEISIFDIRGGLVAKIHKGRLDTGSHSITWRPQNLPSGIYFAKFRADEYSATRKMLFLK